MARAPSRRAIMAWMALLLFGGLGLGALVAAGLSGAHRHSFQRHGLRAQGHVVDNLSSVSVETDDEGSKHKVVHYYPVVEFQPPGGESVRFRGSTGSRVPDYQIGARVPVVYNRANPTEARVDTFAEIWLLPKVLGITGFVFLVLGIGSFLLVRETDEEFDRFEERAAATRETMRSIEPQVRRASPDNDE
jgi:hypothetical protein